MYRLGVSACCRPSPRFLDEIRETRSRRLTRDTDQPADLLNDFRETGPRTLDPEKQIAIFDGDGYLVAVCEGFPSPHVSIKKGSWTSNQVFELQEKVEGGENF